VSNKKRRKSGLRAPKENQTTTIARLRSGPDTRKRRREKKRDRFPAGQKRLLILGFEIDYICRSIRKKKKKGREIRVK